MLNIFNTKNNLYCRLSMDAFIECPQQGGLITCVSHHRCDEDAPDEDVPISEELFHSHRVGVLHLF